ncbi:hypothetical protein [uncultured Lutibacter sp.]|nr:hypothetical protein [uncultured Lutibacter sp.]
MLVKEKIVEKTRSNNSETMYINTLVPNFTFLNNQKEKITSFRTCIAI